MTELLSFEQDCLRQLDLFRRIKTVDVSKNIEQLGKDIEYIRNRQMEVRRQL
jgi:hypothetical protein